MSGRENTYLNAAILGMTRAEIAQRYASIVEYAGIHDFMETPVKRYSSGMRVRLAFAIAAHIDPEILILDEVLNVGDVEFRRKSTATIFEFVNRGNTILFVSHNMESVRSMCTRVMYLDHGEIRYIGDTETAIDLYLQNLKEGANRNLLEVSRSTSLTPVISAARLCNNAGETVTGVPACGEVTLEIVLSNEDELLDPHIDLHIRDSARREHLLDCVPGPARSPVEAAAARDCACPSGRTAAAAWCVLYLHRIGQLTVGMWIRSSTRPSCR